MNSTSEDERRHCCKVYCKKGAGFDVGTAVLSPLSEKPLISIFLVFRTHWGCTFLPSVPSLELPRGPTTSVSCATASFFLTFLPAGRLEAQGSTREASSLPNEQPLLPCQEFLKDCACLQGTWSCCSPPSTRDVFLYPNKHSVGNPELALQLNLVSGPRLLLASFSLSHVSLLLWPS